MRPFLCYSGGGCSHVLTVHSNQTKPSFSQNFSAIFRRMFRICSFTQNDLSAWSIKLCDFTVCCRAFFKHSQMMQIISSLLGGSAKIFRFCGVLFMNCADVEKKERRKVGNKYILLQFFSPLLKVFHDELYFLLTLVHITVRFPVCVLNIDDLSYFFLLLYVWDCTGVYLHLFIYIFYICCSRL